MIQTFLNKNNLQCGNLHELTRVKGVVLCLNVFNLSFYVICSEKITGLEFALKDAEAFRQELENPAGQMRLCMQSEVCFLPNALAWTLVCLTAFAPSRYNQLK